jgi:UDP-N-acetylenolpyruvoylglucosamine reductase
MKPPERDASLPERTARSSKSSGRPPEIRESFSLAGLATIRAGGAAELFARVGERERLIEVLRWAGETSTEVNVVGSGSNLLVADEGVRGLVLKLDRGLAKIAVDGSNLDCGGGARLPSVAAHAARGGLAGIEFGVNIPGTVGGAVRMNANAYGGALSEVLAWVEVISASGARRRRPEELGFTYRGSNLKAGEVVASARFALVESEPERVTATLVEMRTRRHEAQPQGIKTFGSTFKNPPAADLAAAGRTAGLLLSEAGCNGLRIGGARFAPKHANFIENTGAATTADVVALMGEGRRLVAERFGVWLEPEVQTLGPVRFPWQS